MKVVVDLRKLSNKPSGIGMYTYNLIKGLIRRGSIHIIGITDVMNSDQINDLNSDIKIYSYDKIVNNSIDIFPYFMFIRKILEDEKPDYFYEPNFIVPISMKLRSLNTKLVINIYDIAPITYKENYSFIYRCYFSFFLRKTLQYTDKIIYISENGKTETQNKFKKAKRIQSDIVYPIISGIKTENIRDDNYFLFLGNVEKRKGVGILIDSYLKYIDDGGEKSLVIAGRIRDNDIKEKINKAIDYSDNKVKLLGYITDEKKIELFANCSAFVFPSYSEGFGIPPVEALSLNKPIIVSDIDVFTEVYGNCANYFSLNMNNYEKSVDSLKNMLCSYKKPNEELISSLLNKYSESEMVKKIENKYFNKV